MDSNLMNAADFRILLEGKYEQVEQAVARRENATRSLKRGDWDLRRDWVEAASLDDLPDAALVERRARTLGCDEAVILLRRLYASMAELEQQLRLRLRGLGMMPSGGRRTMASRLLDELPVEFRVRFINHRLVPFASALGALALITALVWLTKHPAELGLLFVAVGAGMGSAGAWFLESVTSASVIVTRHRLFVNRHVWLLEDLEFVEVDDSLGGWPFLLVVKERSGRLLTHHITGSPTGLIDVLRRKGVKLIRR